MLHLSRADGVFAVKHSRIAEYHSKKSPVSLDDWETILRATLLQERLEGPSRVILEDVEVSATLVDDGLAIIFRKNLSGITQRIGRIPIRKDENQEIDTIGWVATAATRSEVLEKEVVDLLRRFNEQNDIIQKLNQQLEDLIRTKQRHENLLLEKLMAVLNAKKRKTRDQQRLLATSKVDPSKGLIPISQEPIIPYPTFSSKLPLTFVSSYSNPVYQNVIAFDVPPPETQIQQV